MSILKTESSFYQHHSTINHLLWHLDALGTSLLSGIVGLSSVILHNKDNENVKSWMVFLQNHNTYQVLPRKKNWCGDGNSYSNLPKMTLSTQCGMPTNHGLQSLLCQSGCIHRSFPPTNKNHPFRYMKFIDEVHI